MSMAYQRDKRYIRCAWLESGRRLGGTYHALVRFSLQPMGRRRGPIRALHPNRDKRHDRQTRAPIHQAGLVRVKSRAVDRIGSGSRKVRRVRTPVLLGQMRELTTVPLTWRVSGSDTGTVATVTKATAAKAAMNIHLPRAVDLSRRSLKLIR